MLESERTPAASTSQEGINDPPAWFNEFINKLAGIPMPSKPVYQALFDVESHGWENWEDHVPEYVQPSPFVFYEILVPTTDYILYSDLLTHIMPTVEKAP